MLATCGHCSVSKLIRNEQRGKCYSVHVDVDLDDDEDLEMKRELVCVAVLCALTVLCQVQSAPNVNAGQLVNRLKELLRQRHAHSGKVYLHYSTLMLSLVSFRERIMCLTYRSQ